MSAFLELHDFLLKIGELKYPLIDDAERPYIEIMDREGILGDPKKLLALIDIPDLTDNDFVRKVVTAEEWISDPYYFPGADNIFPHLRDDFINIFDHESRIHDVFMTGSIGYGKSWFAAGCLLNYQIYKLSCLWEPQRFVGLDKTTPITLNTLSITGTQAKTACFHYLKQMVDDTPYYREHFKRYSGADSQLRFPNNILVLPGNSQETSAIGLGVYGATLDEANFLVSASKQAHEKLAAKETSHAMNLYRALKRRIESRFKHAPKGFGGLLITLSSRVTKDDFIDQQISKIRDASGNLRKGYYVIDHSQWDVRGFESGRPTYDRKSGEMTYTGEVFRVVVGGPGQASAIMSKYDLASPDSEIIEVPIEYIDSFEQDLDGSIRDIAGRGTHALNPWFLAQAVRKQAVDSYDNVHLIHPWDDDQSHGLIGGQIIDFNLDAVSKVEVSYEGQGKNKRRHTKRTPIRSPNEPRYIAVDLAKNQDAGGFAMGYMGGWSEIKRIDQNDPLKKTVITERVPIVVIEMIANVVAPIGGVIAPGVFRETIYKLRDECGFYIQRIMFDQYQSLDSINILEGHGFDAVEESVDRDIGPYTQFKNGVQAGTIFYYPHVTLMREMTKLQRVISKAGRVKVDHPEMDFDNPRANRGSKDCADAVCHIVAAIMADYATDAGCGSVGTIVVEPAISSSDGVHYDHRFDPETPEGELNAWILEVARRGR